LVGFAVGVGVDVGVDVDVDVDVGGEDAVDREDVVAVVVGGDIDGYFESDHSDDNSDYQIEVVVDVDDGEYDEIEQGLWDPL
ncbi:hypothetical protein BGZ49_002700, partial [Haplosporangium sp. Z 27]